MENATLLHYFNLTMFMNLGHYRYPVFIFCLLVYAFIVSSNLAMICIIAREKSLHEPMYVFIAFLSVNSLYGSAGFFPRFLMDILSDELLIRRAACLAQIYVIYTYTSYELTILCIMAYDRYVAVCHPLHYSRKMSARVVAVLLFLALACPACYLAVPINTVVRLRLCGHSIEKVYCATWNIVKLSCSANSVDSIGAFFPFGFIVYTYLRIVVSCWRKSQEVRAKVLQRCSPHVISFSIYIFTSFSDSALNREPPGTVNPVLAIVVSLEFIVIPPVLNPLVYGLKLPEIRRHIVRLVVDLRWQSGRMFCPAASKVAPCKF